MKKRAWQKKEGGEEALLWHVSLLLWGRRRKRKRKKRVTGSRRKRGERLLSTISSSVHLWEGRRREKPLLYASWGEQENNHLLTAMSCLHCTCLLWGRIRRKMRERRKEGRKKRRACCNQWLASLQRKACVTSYVSLWKENTVWGRENDMASLLWKLYLLSGKVRRRRRKEGRWEEMEEGRLLHHLPAAHQWEEKKKKLSNEREGKQGKPLMFEGCIYLWKW